MSRKTRLAAAFALGAGLAAAGVALAQTQTGSAAPPAASAQAAPPQSTLPSGTLPSAQPETPAVKPWYTDSNQPTYSVDPPPDTPSGVYLPAAVLGYAKSAAGCVVIGCNDGPQAGGASATSPSASAVLPPANPGPPDPR